jgi:L-lysine 6-transaminase
MLTKNTLFKKLSPGRKTFLSKTNVTNIQPNQVHDILKRTMLVDGYDLVFDPKKSHGSYLHDSITQKNYLDMFSFFASWPLSYDHPKLNDNDFKQKMGEIAIHNPANSDIYTKEFAQFVATFERVCMPYGFNHLFLISTGTLAVENALKVAFDWKVRKNMELGKETKIEDSKVIYFKEAFHGRSGY